MLTAAVVSAVLAAGTAAGLLAARTLPRPKHTQPAQPSPTHTQPAQAPPTYTQPTQPSANHTQPAQPSPAHKLTTHPRISAAQRTSATAAFSPLVSGGLILATATATVGTFGLALSGVGIVAAGTVERPLALGAQLLALVGALLFFGTTQVQLRLQRARCPRCGGDHPMETDHPLTRAPSTRAPTRTRRTAYLVLLGLLPWATVKILWGFGGTALGVTPNEWRESMDASKVSPLSHLLEHFGIDITVLASLAGVLLVLALLHRWALHLPRWLLLLPAWIGAASLTLYGVPLAAWGALTLTGITPPAPDPGPFTPTGLAWMILFGGAAFAGLGTALAISARSYHHRTHPTCATAATVVN